MILVLGFLILAFSYTIKGFKDPESIFQDVDVLDYKSDPVSKCVANIVYNNFPCGTSLTFVCEGESCSYIAIDNEACYPSLTRTFDTKYWLLKTDVYIISLTNVRELAFYVSLLKSDPFWNPEAKFILVVFQCTDDELRHIFLLLGKLYVYNIIVLLATFPGRNNTRRIQLFTYDPFYNDLCGKNFNNIINLGSCDKENKMSFFDNIPNNLTECSFDVAALEEIPHIIKPNNKMFSVRGKYLQGLEEFMLNTMAEIEHIKLNFHYYKNITSGFVLPNLTSTGMLSFLQQGKSDIVIGGYFLMGNRADLHNFVWGYSYAKLLVITPAPRDMIWIKIIFRGFSTLTWVLVVFTYLVVLSIIARMFSKYLRIRKGLILAIKLGAYFYGHADQILFQTKQLRCILIVWIWFTFLVNNFYTTALYSLLTSEFKETVWFDPRNLQAIPYEPCIIDENKNFFLYVFNIKLPEKNKPECKSVDIALDAVANSQDMYTLDVDYSFLFRAYKYFDENGYPMLNYHTFTNVVLNFYVNRGFPLKKKFDRHAIRVFELGLMQYQMKMLCRRRNCQYVLDKIRSRKKFHGLTLDRFKYTFLILLLGYIPAIIIFIIEINRSKE